VPADDKDNARLIVSQIVLNAMESLKLRYPVVSAARKRELQAIRRQLAKQSTERGRTGPVSSFPQCKP
jgi:precorrin-2 methylase